MKAYGWAISGLTIKEKKLVAVDTAVSVGCQRCCNYHFKQTSTVDATALRKFSREPI